MKLRFLLLAEGSSDAALVGPLERLCILAGAREATGIALDPERLGQIGYRVSDKARAAMELEPDVDLLFIHRDADDRDPIPRHREIEAGVAAALEKRPYVGVVPVQATEAWLLLDEAAIRRVAQNPNGKAPVDLPSPQTVEQVARPKQKLEQILVTASELRGRRREKFQKAFSHHRRILMEALDVTGPVASVPSFRRLIEDLQRCLQRMSPARTAPADLG